MAKKKVNKSQWIRDYLAKHPESGPAAVVAAGKTAGVAIHPSAVSNARAKLGVAKKRKRKTRKARASVSNGHVSLPELLATKKLVDQLGVEKVKEALATIAALSK